MSDGKRKILKYLRMAWSSFCCLLCVLLLVLWIRSYSVADGLKGRLGFPTSFLLSSKEGAISCVAFRWHGAENWWRWGLESYPVDDELSFPVGPVEQYQKHFGFGWLDRPMYMVMRSTQTMPDGSQVMVFGAATATLNGAGPICPYWALTALTVFSGLLPWASRRFSLRAFFIAITLFALLLGVVVMSLRS